MSEEARKAEAKGDGTGTFEYRGQTFTVATKYDDWPLELLEGLEDGKVVWMLRGALGPQQWRAIQKMRPTSKDLFELEQKLIKALGFDSAGESGASSD